MFVAIVVATAMARSNTMAAALTLLVMMGMLMIMKVAMPTTSIVPTAVAAMWPPLDVLLASPAAGREGPSSRASYNVA